MDFLIADTFTDSLARLTGDEQKAAKTTAFDLRINPANPGNSFHNSGRCAATRTPGSSFTRMTTLGTRFGRCSGFDACEDPASTSYGVCSVFSE